MRKVFIISALVFLTHLANAQNDFKPVSSDADYFGVWICQDSCTFSVLNDEDAPTVTWLIIDESSSYFSSYISPEFGAAVDIQFTYERSDNTFNGVLVGSNSLGYYMTHEHEKFQFRLYIKDNGGEEILRLKNNSGTFDLIRATL